MASSELGVVIKVRPVAKELEITTTKAMEKSLRKTKQNTVQL